MVYKGYESTEELSVFEKDPDTQGMLILPPSLRTNVYVHHAVDIVLRRDCNLGSTRGWTHRETRVFHASNSSAIRPLREDQTGFFGDKLGT